MLARPPLLKLLLLLGTTATLTSCFDPQEWGVADYFQPEDKEDTQPPAQDAAQVPTDVDEGDVAPGADLPHPSTPTATQITSWFGKAQLAGQGDAIAGTVRFGWRDGHLHVTVVASGFEPGSHALHVHEHGRCIPANDFAAAGGHYNPTDSPHGGPDTLKRHAGDLGNVVADAAGKIDASKVIETPAGGGAAFTSWRRFLGRAVIIHRGADDFTSQPAGDAGPPVACGVIKEVELPRKSE